MKTILMGAAVMAAAAATPASAADFYADFGSSAFSYGSIANGVFTPFPASDCRDIGISQACYRGNDTYRLVAQRPGPKNILVHPGPGETDNTAVLFTASKAGSYRFTANFTRADNGDGVGVSLVGGNATDGYNMITLASLTAGSPTYSLPRAFDFVLNAGDSLGFAIDRGGRDNNYNGDSTFVAGSISGVPEPMTWAMMVLGFGMVGSALRRRTKQTVRVTYA